MIILPLSSECEDEHDDGEREQDEDDVEEEA